MYWHLATTWSHLATFWSHLATSLSQPGSTCFIKGKLLVIYIKLLSFLESCGHIWQLMVTQRKSNINELLMALPNFAQSIYLDCSFVRSFIRSFGQSVGRSVGRSLACAIILSLVVGQDNDNDNASSFKHRITKSMCLNNKKHSLARTCARSR